MGDENITDRLAGVMLAWAADPCVANLHRVSGELIAVVAENDVRIAKLEKRIAELKRITASQRDLWSQMRDDVLHDPDHDSDTINWALSSIDSYAPSESGADEG